MASTGFGRTVLLAGLAAYVVSSGSTPAGAATSGEAEEPLARLELGRCSVDTTAAEPAPTLEVHQVGRGLVRNRALSWLEINGEVSIPTCELLPDCRR